MREFIRYISNHLARKTTYEKAIITILSCFLLVCISWIIAGIFFNFKAMTVIGIAITVMMVIIIHKILIA